MTLYCTAYTFFAWMDEKGAPPVDVSICASHEASSRALLMFTSTREDGQRPSPLGETGDGQGRNDAVICTIRQEYFSP